MQSTRQPVVRNRRLFTSNSYRIRSKRRQILMAMAAAATLGGAFVPGAHAASATWNGADSFWNAANWDNGGAYTPVAGDALFFGSNGVTNTNNDFAAGTSFAGLTFLSGAQSFTLDGNDIVLTGPITVNSGNGNTQTINFGFTGATAINLGADGSAGNNLTLNADASAGALAVSSTTGTSNTLTIGTGKTLTIGGALTVGVQNTTAAGIAAALTVTGDGTLNATSTGNANFLVGRGSTSASGQVGSGTLDASGLSNFAFSTNTGTIGIGVGTRGVGVLLLANTSNSLTAATMSVGDTGSGNNGGNSLVSLGAGSNVIRVNQLNIGGGKSAGVVNFAGDSGTLSIGGEAGGTATTNMLIGRANSATGTGTTSQLLLAGHDVTVNAGSITVGQLAGASGGTDKGEITFDTGVFNVATLQLAQDTSGTAGNGTTGTFTLGSGANSTGVLNVGSALILGNNSNGNATATNAKAIFNINGGTANINGNISVINTSTNASATAVGTINLAGGTLNMTGHQINDAPGTGIGTLNMIMPAGGNTATIANLGGSGINGAGLTMDGGGTLVLSGNNTYTGGTNINSGVLQISGGVAGPVNNNGSLVLAPAVSGGATVSGDISGGGAVSVVGPGEARLSGNNSYTSDTNVSGGALVVNGQLLSSTTNLNTDTSSATLGGTGNVGTVNLAANNGSNVARIAPGATTADGDAGTLTVASLNVNGGDFRLDLNGTGAGSFDVVHVTGDTQFNAPSTISIAPGSASGHYVILMTDGTATGTAPTLSSTTSGRSTFTLDTSNLNAIAIDVTGGAASLVWKGTTDGTTWDSGTTANWDNNGTLDVFFLGDNVTFNDSNNGNYNVTLNSTAVPGSVTVDNSAGTYTISGTGAISGATGLTKGGSGALVLATDNTYTGATVINSGTLQLGAGTTSGSVAASSAITDNGALVINRSDTLTISGAITGSGQLRQAGSGTLVLAADNSYAGTTTIDSGTLQVGTGTTSGSLGAGDVVNNGALVINRSDSVTLSNLVSGTGSLVKSGAGTVTVTAANSYSGQTVVNGGTLSISSSDNIGDASATNTIALASGALQSTGSSVDLGANRSIALGTGGGTLDVGDGNVLTVPGQISGNAALNKTGAGKLILTADNSGFANMTSISGGGVIEIGNVNSLLNSAGTIFFNNGTLHITADMTAANTANKFTTTSVGASSSSKGTFDVDAGVTFEVGVLGSGTPSLRTAQGGGIPSGSSFTKTGLGTMIINGQNNQLDSSFNLNQGTLVYTEAGAGGGPAGGSTVNIADAATLILRNDASTDFYNTGAGSANQSQNISVVSGATANLLIDRATAGDGVTHTVGTVTLNSSTLNVGYGANITSGSAGFASINPLVLTGDGTLIANKPAAAGVSGLVTFNGATGTDKNLTIGGDGDTLINGAVATGAGSVTKLGSGVATLSGDNSYTGVTTVQAGKLILANNAKNLVLGSGGGADVQGGRLVLDYNDTGTAPDVLSILDAGFDQTPKFSTGPIRTSNPEATDKGLGWKDDPTAKQVTVAYTYYGDANLDGQVDVTDLGALATNWQTSNVWAGGDFNYDGFVDVTDLGALATNWQKGVGSPLGAGSLEAALQSVGLGNVSVPEPASIGLIGIGLIGLASRRRRRADMGR